MKPLFHFLITLPTGESFTCIGGGLKPSKQPNHVWLTLPNGAPAAELPASYVQPTTFEQTASRISEYQLASKAPHN